jgi:predicted PurR-regulated permease PerM
MQIDDKDIKKIAVVVLVAILALLLLYLLRPVLISIVGGLILAYIFSPLFSWITTYVRNTTFAALLVSLGIILVIALPLWFVIPLMAQQVFGIYVFFQNANLQAAVASLFPTASEQFIAQVTLSVNGFIAEIVTRTSTSLGSYLEDLPTIFLHMFIVFFVFFFALRDGHALRSFVGALSPFSKTHEKVLVQQFKDITDSVVYGQIIVGLVQGGLAGIGFLLFGVENVLVLTVLATFLAVLPIVGPFIIWIPIGIYMLVQGQVTQGALYILYNFVVVSLVDNILRTYLIARKVDISPAIVLVAMVGGFFVFGLVGFLLGPLIASYFLTFLKSYKDRTFHELIIDKE